MVGSHRHPYLFISFRVGYSQVLQMEISMLKDGLLLPTRYGLHCGDLHASSALLLECPVSGPERSEQGQDSQSWVDLRSCWCWELIGKALCIHDLFVHKKAL